MVMFSEFEVKKANGLRNIACGQAHGKNGDQEN